MWRYLVVLFAVTFCASASADSSMYQLDEALPTYKPAELSGKTIHSVGSDSMEGIVEAWVERYGTYQPEMTVQVLSRGSATAPAALIEGTAELGPMARPMKTFEVGEFRAKYGFAPTQIRTALAGVAVYVPQTNPLTEISYEQLDGIFSEDLKRGLSSVSDWSELGLKLGSVMALGEREHPYAKAYFRQQVMKQGTFTSRLKTIASFRSLMEAVAANRGAIAFGTVADPVPGVKTLAVSRAGAEEAITPTAENLRSGNYPLARYLNIYIVRRPGEELDLATKDFLRFILSKEGQQMVVERGLIPLPASVAKEELKKVL